MITADIYGITNHVNNLKKEYFASNEESLMTGTLGYIGAVLANQWQNQIVVTSQYANEAIPTQAKFKRSIIAHALSFDGIDITATPATMDIQLFLLENEVIENLNNNDQFIIDSSIPIYIGGMEFHLDYDIIIKRVKLKNDYVYTAQYSDIKTNPISDIDNPYLRPPVIIELDKAKTILILCKIHQVTNTILTRKIISSSSIENKTFSFEFEDQLASFHIVATDGDVSRKLTPVYVGMYDGSIDNYFNYEYLDDKTIRVKFDNQSYIPRINTVLEVYVITTKGTAGIFKYNDETKLLLKSTKYGYSNITCIIRPATESTYGAHDTKTIKELKQIIPKEALSRGNITTATDLNNYFSMINTADNKLYFYKRRHNQFSLLFYAYFLFRDSLGNILPTNTISLSMIKDDFTIANDNKLVLTPGSLIKYIPNDSKGYIIPEEDYDPTDTSCFYYTVPFNMVVNQDPLYVSYYLNIINSSKLLEFSWVNQESEVQFIASNVNWYRNYSEDLTIRNRYTMSIDVLQNVLADKGIYIKNPGGDDLPPTVNIKVFAVFYGDTDVPYRYRELELSNYNEQDFLYSFNANFTTEDMMTNKDKLVINDVSDINNTNADDNYGDFPANVKVEIYVAVKYEDGRHGINNLIGIVPGIDDWTITNKYTVIDGIDMFYKYSDIIASVATVSKDGGNNTVYNLRQVPVVKYSYLTQSENVYEFIDQMEIRRDDIYSCLNKLEGNMGIDFKFYNTYGPSRTYFVTEDAKINRVNLHLKFRTKILSGADKYIRDYIIQDIKDYIEDIDDIKDLHMPNITTLIETKYEGQIQYFQFVGINEYDTSIQHVTCIDELDVKEDDVPELLNIDVNPDGSPMIDLIIDL